MFLPLGCPAFFPGISVLSPQMESSFWEFFFGEGVAENVGLIVMFIVNELIELIATGYCRGQLENWVKKRD